VKRALAAVAVAAAFVAGCGGSSDSSRPTLKVSAAASLKKALTAYGGQFDEAKAALSFAGSDQLAAQIEQGAPVDVYAAANTKLPEQLYSKGLIEKPVVFASNTLVVAVPAGSKITSFGDLAKSGVKIAAGAASVPVGSYTQKVLSGLPAAEHKAITDNIVSSEPDVAGVVGKVSEGAADAGFVYVTDVKATGGRLTAIQIPASLNPTAAYGAAVVKKTKHSKQAHDFLNGLVNGAGQNQLRQAGFGAAPAQ
jgi:molybdate transport system substrate-binding protein